MKPYKFTRHAWGVISSPYIACAAIRKAADENPTNASTLTKEIIRKGMYMDDLLCSCHSIEKAQLIADETVKLFDRRGFNLVKWFACKTAKSIIVKKEPVAAVIVVDLMQSAFKALQLPECIKSFRCDSKVVMQWISNPDLLLNKFTWRRTNYILLHSTPEEWQCRYPSFNSDSF